MFDRLRKWNMALSASKGAKALLAWTFFLQMAFMAGNWPDPPPVLPPVEQSYDLNVLFDPTSTPTVCRPVDVLLDNPCGIPVLR